MVNQSKQVKRFFSPIIGLVALAVLALGILISVAGISGVTAGERGGAKVSIFGLILVACGIAAFFGAAFRKGCATCRTRFTQATAEFPPTEYDRVVGIVNSGDPAAIRSLLYAPPTQGSHRACLELGYCEKCRQVGELRALEMRHNGQYDHFERGTKELPVSAAVVEAALAVVNGREAPLQR